MSDYIATFTGHHFYPLEPDSNDVYIEDIAHALSMLCRGNGHVSSFFSVGQHCLNCANEAKLRGFSPRIVLACLLHDASECYLSDVPRPFKKEIKEYIEWENSVLSVVYNKFLGSGLTEEEQRIVKKIDDDMLSYDLKYLLGEKVESLPELHIELDYSLRPFQDVEDDYLKLFKEMSRLI